MIKTFAQCSGDHKLGVSTEFPMDQGWVLGYVEYQSDTTHGLDISEGLSAVDGVGRKRVCIEAWADEAAFRPNVGHYCSLACAVAHLERALVTKRYNGTSLRERSVPSAPANIPYRAHHTPEYANDAA